MTEVQQLREQLEELGFILLKRSEAHAASVLDVEVWVRYTPYALIPIPIRGNSEDDASYNSRISIANDSIADLFVQDENEAILLSEEQTEPVVELPEIEEPIQEEEPYVSPLTEDYYAYKPKFDAESATSPYPQISVEEPEALEVEKPVEDDSTEYDKASRDKLVQVRLSLLAAVAEIDAILGN